MSTDFQIAWPCPHLAVEERVILGDDRRSLPTRHPIAGAGTVRILANDDLFIPQGGYHVPATLYGTDSGPYDLVENEDVFTIETPTGSETVTFSVTGTVRLGADQVIKILQRNEISVVSFENYDGHLVFTDANSVGTSSYVEVSGSAAASLGFGSVLCTNSGGSQRRAEGKQIYPGWTLESREDTITNRYPKFLTPIRTNPYFKLTYTMPPERCSRCRGSLVENDYRFNPSGQAILIEKEDLLYQAALKILLTDKGSNPYHPWYGSNIRERIGAKALSGVQVSLSEDIRKALERFQALQTEQAKYQSVSFKERMYSVNSVEVRPHQSDPTTFLIRVIVQNASSEPITLSIVYTVPGVVALMGSNGLSLGTSAVGLSNRTTVSSLPQSSPLLEG